MNYSTSPGKANLEAAECARFEVLAGGPVYEFPGFPGLLAVAAGGHTPGSTIYLARVKGQIWVFAGDVTNFMQNLRENRPKPLIYSLLIVPESRSRLEELRTWLLDLDARSGFKVLVSHDLDAIEKSPLPAWHSALRRKPS